MGISLAGEPLKWSGRSFLAGQLRGAGPQNLRHQPRLRVPVWVQHSDPLPDEAIPPTDQVSRYRGVRGDGWIVMGGGSWGGLGGVRGAGYSGIGETGAREFWKGERGEGGGGRKNTIQSYHTLILRGRLTTGQSLNWRRILCNFLLINAVGRC